LASDRYLRRNVASDRIHELLQRNLQEVFGERDAARRRAAIDELNTEDCVLYVPARARSSGAKASTNLLEISVRTTVNGLARCSSKGPTHRRQPTSLI